MRSVFVYDPAITSVSAKSIVPLVVIVPPSRPVPAVTLVTVPLPPDGVAHVLSPRKNVELLAVPLADRSAETVPVTEMPDTGLVATLMNVPFRELISVTVPVPPVASMVIVVPETLVEQFVPPATVIVPAVVMAVPLPESAPGVMLVTVPVPDGAAQVLSPRKKVVASAVPVAERSAETVPVVVMPATGSVATSMKTPFSESTSVTVPVPAASIHDISKLPSVEST
mgnify:CR=1 FL=1